MWYYYGSACKRMCAHGVSKWNIPSSFSIESITIIWIDGSKVQKYHNWSIGLVWFSKKYLVSIFLTRSIDFPKPQHSSLSTLNLQLVVGQVWKTNGHGHKEYHVHNFLGRLEEGREFSVLFWLLRLGRWALCCAVRQSVGPSYHRRLPQIHTHALLKTVFLYFQVQFCLVFFSSAFSVLFF